MGETAKQSTRQAQAQEIVKKHSLWAMGAGGIPVPGLDIVAATLVNVRMIRELAEHYDMPFDEHVAKSILSSLIGGASAIYLGRPLLFSLLKGVPIIGTTAGVVSGAVATAALSRTVGNVFIQHFETGGTLLSFDANALRAHFMREFEKNQKQKTEAGTPPAADKPPAATSSQTPSA